MMVIIVVIMDGALDRQMFVMGVTTVEIIQMKHIVIVSSTSEYCLVNGYYVVDGYFFQIHSVNSNDLEN